MSKPTVIYYRWVYSPSTGDVTLSHNHEGHPTDIRLHHDMAEERSERDLINGFAHRSSDNWSITDEDSKPVDDPNIIYEVVHAITKDEKRRKMSKLSYDAGTEKWAWLEGQPVEKWEDSEWGSGYDGDFYDVNTMGDYTPKEGYDEGGVRAHFVVLVELALKDPKLREGAEHWRGKSYESLGYSNVAAFLNESGKKWAIGTYDDEQPTGVGESDQYGEHMDYNYEAGLDVGAHGPTTTNADIEAAVGEKVVTRDRNQYGLSGDYKTWDDDNLWDDDDAGLGGTMPPTTFS